MRKVAIFLLVLLGLLIFEKVIESVSDDNWKTAKRNSAGIAPDPQDYSEAVFQIYAARAYSWKSYFATHTWIAVKEQDAQHYSVYQVLGYYAFFDKPVLSIHDDIPDRYWFNNLPNIIYDKRGPEAVQLIKELKDLVPYYPYQQTYFMWPGPNSNTFVAWVARNIVNLNVELPNTAIGKDFIGDEFFAATPSGTGYQISFFGVFGILVGKAEGVEINIAGLVFGFDPMDLQLKLPMLGEVNLL